MMENALSRIELYNTLFFVFTSFAAVSFVVTVVLFIRFDIPEVYALLTGKARRKSIERMERRAAQTGKLRMRYRHTGDTSRSGYTGPRKSRSGQIGKTAKPTEETREPKPQIGETPKHQTTKRSTPEQQCPKSSKFDTESLRATQRPQTEVLMVETPDTVVLQASAAAVYPEEKYGKTEILSQKAEPDFLFQITQNLIEIHTNELI